jgi:c-di-GMP-binding flagellar brake protein YcgR
MDATFTDFSFSATRPSALIASSFLIVTHIHNQWDWPNVVHQQDQKRTRKRQITGLSFLGIKSSSLSVSFARKVIKYCHHLKRPESVSS